MALNLTAGEVMMCDVDGKGEIDYFHVDCNCRELYSEAAFLIPGLTSKPN